MASTKIKTIFQFYGLPSKKEKSGDQNRNWPKM